MRQATVIGEHERLSSEGHTDTQCLLDRALAMCLQCRHRRWAERRHVRPVRLYVPFSTTPSPDSAIARVNVRSPSQDRGHPTGGQRACPDGRRPWRPVAYAAKPAGATAWAARTSSIDGMCSFAGFRRGGSADSAGFAAASFLRSAHENNART
jgi:hypothetical protein